MIRPLAAAVVVWVVSVASAVAGPRTWTVGGEHADFPLIAPAIAAAAAGDEIRVARGVYREDLVVDKPLKIVGDGRPVLFGTGIGTVVTLVAPGCEISGFAIEGSGTGQTNEMDAAIRIASNGNRVADNQLRRTFYGVVVTDAMHNDIVDNEIAGFAELPFGRRGDGIYLYRAPENFVARNRIAGERDAIYFQYAPRGRAVDNIVSASRYGLHDMFSDEVRIAGNTFGDSAVGANIMNSRRITIERNRFVRNSGVPGVGLTLKDCDDSTIRGNEIGDNPRGLLVDGSSSNRFTDNILRVNDTAVTLFSSSERNRFSGNEFLDNWSDLILSGRDSSTEWSMNGRGNYWSRYRGFDFDGDGIGDTAHPLLGAFERLEGNNPAARIFLQSPAAAGLELAARLSAAVPSDAVDDRPLVRPTSNPSPSRPARPALAASLAMLIVGVAALEVRAARARHRRFGHAHAC